MQITRDRIIEGEKLLIHKDLYWTSFDVVKKVKYLLQHKFNIKNLKVGHAGSLDPMATGLVVLCTGKATKQIDEIQGYHKEYMATIKLGETTPSFDMETDVDHRYPIQHIGYDLVIEVLNGFKGEINQVPPVFSAKKYGGKRAYEFARKGEKIQLEAKKINIHDLKLVKFDLPNLIVYIKCSKGTYIRSFARDIGIELNSGAYLTSLQRIAIGPYAIDEAIRINEFEEYIHLL